MYLLWGLRRGGGGDWLRWEGGWEGGGCCEDLWCLPPGFLSRLYFGGVVSWSADADAVGFALVGAGGAGMEERRGCRRWRSRGGKYG